MTLWRGLAACLALAATLSTAADFNSPAEAPFAAKASQLTTFRVPPGAAAATRLELPAPDPALVAEVKRANASRVLKALQVGVGRKAPPHARGARPAWHRVAGGHVAHWVVASQGAVAVRVGLEAAGLPKGAELRFSGAADPALVYGPVTPEDIGAQEVYWSPVLEGERATVELFVPGTAAPEARVVVAQVSHLFALPRDAHAELVAKTGESGTCQVDLACRTGADAALATTGKAVARMLYTDGGSSYLCTGTLLNAIGGSFTPYFYTANHCIPTQLVASSLTTHWFFDRAGCGTGGTSPAYVQRFGGATLMFTHYHSDSTLLRLDSNPPPGAVYAGWDSATLSTGTNATAVHHPKGDWKKVSLGGVSGYESNILGRTSSFIEVHWPSTLTGVTEPGSSGSGLFTAVGAPASEYRLRGGLFAGSSSCSAPVSALYDYYSRFDQVYPSIASLLNPPPSTYPLTVSRSGDGSGTVTSNPAGINCGATCTANYVAGTSVTLTAAATAGSTFSSWSGGGCSGAGSCTVSMSAARTVTATFTALADDFPDSPALAGFLGVTSSVSASIHVPGDVDWVRYGFTGPGSWTLRTFGSTDTAGEVYAADAATLLAANDDGTDLNFSISMRVHGPSSVYARITGAEGATGSYTLSSTFTPTWGTATDLNADGRSDLLYRNAATGQVYRIFMNGLATVGEAMVYHEPDLAWRIVADADFNGDGVADLLWRNAATGQVYLMPFAASGFPAGGAVIWTEPDPAWRIVATPDIDGDKRHDILWWNATTGLAYAMRMSGTTILNHGPVYQDPNTQWKIVAVGDFAGSGRRNQLVWQNSATGQVYLMTVNLVAGAFVQSGLQIYEEPNTAWRIIAAADFDGNGRSDLLWRNAATGQVYMMLMNGGSIAAAAQVYAEPNLAWKIVATGDHDGDGKADILYRNDATGMVYLLRMDGLAVAGGGVVYVEPNTAWRALGLAEYAE